MKQSIIILVMCLFAVLPPGSHAAADARQAEVASRGAGVMPFSLAATTHVFTKAADGGAQRVVAKNAADAREVRLVREHLREIETQFRNRDFSGPARIHGDDMPGLAVLRRAGSGELTVSYREVTGGAELTYRGASPAVLSALHAWFDAQLEDHGGDAMAGPHHDQHQGSHRH